MIVASNNPPCLYVFAKNLELIRKIDLTRAGINVHVAGIAGDNHSMNLYMCNHSYNGCVHVLSLKGEGEFLYSFSTEQL